MGYALCRWHPGSVLSVGFLMEASYQLAAVGLQLGWLLSKLGWLGWAAQAEAIRSGDTCILVLPMIQVWMATTL